MAKFDSGEFKQENWKTKSAKFAGQTKDATVSGAVGAKNLTLKAGKSIKEKDWTREKNGVASAGSATGRGIVKAGTWTGSTISGGVKSLFTKKPAA